MNRDMRRETPSVTVVTKSCDIEMRFFMRTRINYYYYPFTSPGLVPLCFLDWIVVMAIRS